MKKNEAIIFTTVVRKTTDLPRIFKDVWELCKDYPHHTVIVNYDQGSGSEVINCKSTDYVDGVKDLYRMLPFSEWWFDHIGTYTRKSSMYREIRKGLKYYVGGGFKLKVSVAEKF